MKPRSKRETALLMNRAHRDMGLLYDKLPMITETVSAPRRQRERGSNPDASPLEKDVLKAVWAYLSHHPKVAWCSRINSGGTYFDNNKGGQQFMRFNYKRGMSDLIGQMKDGRFLACECKREGANLEDHQREFLNEVRAANGVAFVARNVQDCMEALALK